MNKTKVMIVEDDINISKLISDYLSAHGYDMTAFHDGPDAIKYVKQSGLPHIALIDLGLPTMHGFELSSKLKAMGDLPIIFITANSDTDTIVQGLKRFADDFLVKPFDLRELEARIQTVLSRISSLDYASQPIAHIDDNLSIDFAHSRITLSGKPINLTPTESILLYVLLRNAECVVENRLLIARVWPSEDVFEDTLQTHIHRLRQKIEHDPKRPKYILTERGIGYKFTIPPLKILEHSILSQDEKDNGKEDIVILVDTGSSLDELKRKVAQANPQCIVLKQTDPYHTLSSLREFDLATHLPIVVAMPMLNLREIPLLIEAGADELCEDDEATVLKAVEVITKQYQASTLYNPKNIIIVTTDMVVAEVIRHGLSNLNGNEKIVQINSLEQLLREISQSTRGLIVLDTTLTGTDGLNFVSQIREQGISAPIVLIAASPSFGVLKRQYELSIRGYLVKPLFADAVHTTINRLMRTSKMLDLYSIQAKLIEAKFEMEFEISLRTNNPQLASEIDGVWILISGMAHDLKNVITFFKFSVEASGDRLTEVSPIPEGLIDKFAPVVGYSRILIAVLTGIRSFKDWNPKLYPIKEEDHPLRDLMRKIAKHLRYRGMAGGIGLETDASKNPTMLVDLWQLEQALLLLVLILFRTTEDEMLYLVAEATDIGYQFRFSSQQWSDRLLTTLINYSSKDHPSLARWLIVEKIIRHHRGAFSMEGRSLVVTLPSQTTDPSMMRMEIAELSIHSTQLEAQLQAFAHSEPTSNSLSLIGDIAYELFDEFKTLKKLSDGANMPDAIVNANFGLLLVGNLLTIISGKVVNRKAIDLRVILEMVLKMRHIKLTGFTVNLDVNIQTPSIYADEVTLLQIVVNLVDNAMEAMGDSGSLQISAHPSGNEVVVRVADTGKGIPPSLMSQIFDLHFTTKGNRKRGIGLFAVKTLIDELGGKIQVSSTVDQGTQILFTLPSIV